MKKTISVRIISTACVLVMVFVGCFWNSSVSSADDGASIPAVSKVSTNMDTAEESFHLQQEAATSALGTFGDKVDYATNLFPVSLAVADVNGDKRTDLIVLNAGAPHIEGGTVSVMLNKGDGTFDTKVDYATGDFPCSLAVADVDGDGHPDLIVLDMVSDANGDTFYKVSVMHNNGDNTFASPLEYDAGATPVGVTVGDFNSDGHPDLAVSDQDSNKVYVLLNKGDGTFYDKAGYNTGTGPRSVAVSDVNGDGHPDLAVVNTNSDGFGVVSVLRNNGNGTFAAAVDYRTGVNPWSVVAADFDGDGHPDLAVSDQDSNKVSVFLNKGDGTFAAKADYDTGAKPAMLAVADVHIDGHLDLIVTNLGDTPGQPGTVSVLLNDGNGAFPHRTDYATGINPRSVAVGDLDGNFSPDLVVTNTGDGISNGTVSVFLNNGASTPLPSVSKIAFTTSAQTVAAGAVSGAMTVQTWDASNNPVNVNAATVINLTSSSATGKFDTSASGQFNVTSVSIPADSNSVSFYYKDTKAGTATITAASGSLIGDTQQETITVADVAVTFPDPILDAAIRQAINKPTVPLWLGDSAANNPVTRTPVSTATILTSLTSSSAPLWLACRPLPITSRQHSACSVSRLHLSSPMTLLIFPSLTPPPNVSLNWRRHGTCSNS